MSAFQGKADVFRFNFGSLRLNVRFSPKRTLSPLRNSNFQGPLSANSGRRGLNSNVRLIEAQPIGGFGRQRGEFKSLSGPYRTHGLQIILET